MITKGLRAVIIVNVEDILIAVKEALEKRLDPTNTKQLDLYYHAVMIRAIESVGLAQVANSCRHKYVVDDRLLGWIDKIANDASSPIWRLFSQLNIHGWFWIDDLKVVHGRELWLCWTK